MNIFKPCPFCGSNNIELKEGSWKSNDYMCSGYDYFYVKCLSCGAKSNDHVKKYLREFTDHTVEDFRNNPLLYAKVEDEYEKYIEELKEIVIKSWNKRIK